MLDRRERSGDILAALLAVQENISSRLWVCMPGIVQSFNPAKRTCVVQPSTKAQIQSEDGSYAWVQMPLLVDCPVLFPGGGDVVLTFPLKLGDEVLVHFGDRCIDAWWQNGGIQNQAELRMHDLSDGFAMPGPSSLPRVETGIDPTRATLRSRDGLAYVSLDPVAHIIDIIAPGAEAKVAPNEVKLDVGTNLVDVTPSSVHVAAGSTILDVLPTSIHMVCGVAVVDLTPTGINAGCGGSAGISMTATNVTITGAVTIAGHDFVSHHHSGVTTGGGNTGNVV
jgi:hypothetical protein